MTGTGRIDPSSSEAYVNTYNGGTVDLKRGKPRPSGRGRIALPANRKGLEMFVDFSDICRTGTVLPTRAPALIEGPMEPAATTDAHLPRMTLTIKLRLRDKHAAELNRQARAVNFCWNYLNETQQKAVRP